MRKRRIGITIAGLVLVYSGMASPSPGNPAMRPGHPDWPRVWMSYRKVISLEADIKDMQDHGVGLMSWGNNGPEQARKALALAHKTGMTFHIDLPEVTEHRDLVEKAGLEPVPAVMIGGVYQGNAVDRHLFSFTATQHRIVIEPPVYNQTFAYSRRKEKFGHYYPDIGAPLRAEVIVPLRPFDGRQHLRILPARVSMAPAGTKPSIDSVTAEMPTSTETSQRKLYHLDFDLTGFEDAVLGKVGLAVYWEYRGYPHYWMFGRGTVSAWAPSTQEALRRETRRVLGIWSDGNGGTFPGKEVPALRFGDECFYTTGHLNGPASNYPLWDYSKPAIEAFRQKAGSIAYPRTWGFPEIYGAQAYAWWLYTLHEGCARLCGIIREEIADLAPGLLLFRNTTRMGIFHASNDFDGSGQELLTRNLDIVHYDPYPVGAQGYSDVIPRDMHYGAGLARRYKRLLVPWMQAHTYAPGGLTDVSPEQVARMAEEQWVHGVDAIIWLGYGSTFPKSRPDSWERAGLFHQRLNNTPPPKPKPQLAVLRPYATWALSSRCDGRVRNPADWLLQKWLEVWAVQHGQAYDVFEVPPDATEAHIRAAVKAYPQVVSTMLCQGAWVIGAGTEGTSVDTATAGQVQKRFEREMKERGWLE